MMHPPSPPTHRDHQQIASSNRYGETALPLLSVLQAAVPPPAPATSPLCQHQPRSTTLNPNHKAHNTSFSTSSCSLESSMSATSNLSPHLCLLHTPLPQPYHTPFCPFSIFAAKLSMFCGHSQSRSFTTCKYTLHTPPTLNPHPTTHHSPQKITPAPLTPSDIKRPLHIYG